jgi:hypothetical protein
MTDLMKDARANYFSTLIPNSKIIFKTIERFVGSALVSREQFLRFFTENIRTQIDSSQPHTSMSGQEALEVIL